MSGFVIFCVLALPAVVRAALGDPTLSVAPIVPLGGDIIVKWTANDGLSGRSSADGEWIGLFKRNDCGAASTANAENQHACFLGWRTLDMDKLEGHVAFRSAEYKEAGLYEARIFRGDTVDSHGRACASVQGYTRCVYEVAAVSSVINIPGDISHMEDTSGAFGVQGLNAVYESINLNQFRRETNGPGELPPPRPPEL